MKIFTPSCFLVLSICMLSCKKENHPRWTEVNVLCTDYYTDQPISGLPVVVYQSTGGLITDYKKKIECESELVNGEFSCGFKAKGGPWSWTSRLKISMDYSEYRSLTPLGGFLDDGGTNNFHHRLFRVSSVVFHFSNVNFFDENDKMRFKVHHLDEETLMNPSNYPAWSHAGTQDVFVTENIPFGNYRIDLELTRNGIVTEEERFFSLFNDNDTVLVEY